jgi:hypothetical protein
VDEVADDMSDPGIVDAVESWFAARDAQVRHVHADVERR